MSRALRLLTTTTALTVAAALIPATAGAAPAPDRSPGSVSSTSAAPSAPSKVPSSGPSGVRLGTRTLTSTDYVAFQQTPSRTTSARATTWPVGGGKADLKTHAITPKGAAAQQLSSVALRHYRAHGGVFEATVKLRGTPTAETRSVIVLAFGKLNGNGACTSFDDSNVLFTSTDTDSANNPVYQGATIKIRPFRMPSARKATWNCAFARSAASEGTLFSDPYDVMNARAGLFRQKPILGIRVANRTISSRAYTTIPVTITNSTDTVATAYNTRLKVEARGLSYRFNPDVGTIRPGDAKKGSIKLKYTSRYRSYFIITVRTGDYVKKVKYIVTPVN